MKVGILGTGEVGKALGAGFIALGHQVMIGGREAGNPKSTAWAKEIGSKASAGTFAQCAQFGEMVVLATLGLATEGAIRLAGPENFRDKVVLDATNPLDFSKGMPPRLVGGVGDSAGEKHQKLLPLGQVVKAFNTVGHGLMFRPKFPVQPDMFICGEHSAAKERVAQVCRDFGWGVVDVGGISSAHFLECMCMVWVISGAKANNWNQAFKLLR